MNCIKEETSWIKAGLIRQPILEQPYRMSTFVIKLQIKDGFLLYNSATGCILHFDNEQDLLNSRDTLISNWFLLPTTNFDEFLWIDFLRDKKSELLASKHTKSYIIMTTMDCNARCFYCYEKGRKPITMTAKTASDLSNFITENSEKNNTKLTWFGGEPLLNFKVIDSICTNLHNNGVNFYSHIISNGLLFSENIVKRARTLWHLNRVQITIDGTEKTYLRIKDYKGHLGNEFQRVICNIENLLKNNVSVSIRLNQSLDNTTDLLDLVEYIRDKFPNYAKLSVYNRLLFDEEITNKVQEAYFDLKHKIMRLGLLKPKYEDPIRFNRCMADSAYAYVVTPNGHLGKCEHFSENYLIGTLSDKEFDQQVISQFKEKYENTPLCKTCPLYPSCVRLKMCPSEKEECSDFLRDDYLDSIRFMMREEYNQHIQIN